MAEETAAPSAPAATAGESVAERAPSAEPKAGPADSAPETRPEQEKENASEQPAAPSAGASAPEPEKKDDQAETKPEEPGESADAKEEGDKEEETAEAGAPAPETNGTPASAKKAANGKRKSTGGVAEHKTPRKLGRKKSQARITHLDAKPGEYYLARLKSYPPWPSIICDEEMLPQTLLNTRPVTTKQADGTYREPYADGGKRVHERTFPIMFLETNEFAWIPNTELTPLTPDMCKEAVEKGKQQKALLAAYKVAQENHDLQYFKNLLADHQRAMQQEAEDREAKAAAKEKKKKRKSMEVVDDQEDVEMAEAEEEEGKKSKATKKRKKDVESDGEAEKPVKTPKTTTKLKLTTPKTPATAETKKTTASAKATRGKATGAKRGGKAAVSDEEMAVETPKEPEKTIDPQEAKVKKQKEILYIRHKLQKGFISRDQAPKEEEMAAMSNFFSKLEAHSDLEVSIIRATKINKVLKMIVKLNTIPKDEEYHFRRRAIDILAKWKNLLESDTTPAAAAEDQGKGKPTANGVHKDDEGDESVDGKAEKTDSEEKETEEKPEERPAKEESAAESKDQDTPMPDAEAEEKAQAPEEPAKESEEAAPKEGETEKTAEETAA